MKAKQYVVLLVLLLILPLFFNCRLQGETATAQTTPDLYFGVDVAFGSVEATKQIIDNVSSYTNFFIIGCSGDYNETRLTDISQYVYSKGLTFIVFSDDPHYPSKEWFATAQSSWGKSLLGVYFYDEPGGRQLDQAKYPTVPSARNYSDAAQKYVGITNWWLHNERYSITNNFAYPTEYQLFTSDYALYWYDYQGGYDTVFAEFGSNYSRQLNVALCRGAATALGKDWGVIITWTYRQPPYIESGPELYDDLVLAYENGAKYIVIFDSDVDYSESILEQQQFDAMKQFWQYTQDNPRSPSPVNDRTAYVLPQYYAYGFRGPTDRIWGLWDSDELTSDLCLNMSALMLQYGTNLDIIYPDAPQTIESVGYRDIFYWNDTRLAPTPSPSPDPSQTTASTLPFYETPTYFYAVAASILLVAAVATTAFALKFRKKAA